MKANVNRVPIQETHTLPSNGLLYKDLGIPAEITLRAMTTLDEKRRLSSTGMQVIPNLLNSCIIEPDNIDTTELKLFDLQFLMYKERIITYGSEYKISIKCPHCGETAELKVNLDEVPVNVLPDDFVEPFTIGPLPVSKDVVECKILSASDYIKIEREAKRIKSKFPDYEGDPEFMLTYQYKIVSINGEPAQANRIQKYVEEMHMQDTRYFDSKYAEVIDNIGMDTAMVDECPHCGRDIEYNLPITDEFFRPTY